MARLDDLPLEILALVLVSIKHLDTLRHVSLVSRILHQAAFPLLHHTIKLQKNSDIEGFFELVESEDSSSPCRISQALRRLEFTNEIDLISDEEEPRVKELLNQFKIVIPKLVGLKRLVWNVTKCRYTPMVLSEFQRWCPNLRSLKISAFGSHVPTKESYSQMLGFRDMTYIYLVSSSPNAKAGYRLREHIQDVIVNMIQSSPSLESLGLGLCNYLDASRWDIDNFLEVLNTTFLKLRHLYLWGDFAIDWDHIFHRHHQPSPTRLFFNQHPHLVTLSVGHNPKFSIPVEPRQVQELFPALRHFNGPEFICVALVQSDLRFQLESLEIRVRRYQFGVIKRMADAVTQLPRLHRLVIPGNPKYEQALLTVLSAAPLIEVLDITSYFIWLCSSEELLAVFNHAYNLCELVVRLKDQAYDGRTPITIESFVSRLGRMCPRLETVTNSYGRFQGGLVTHHIVR